MNNEDNNITMAPKTPSDADTNTGTSETTVDDSVEKPSIKPAGWTPDLTLPLGSINGELSALTKLTPRDLGLAKQLEGEEDVTDEVETEHIKQKNTETIKSLLNIDQPLAGPRRGERRMPINS